MTRAPTIAILYNTTIYVAKFRLNLIDYLRSFGCRVVVISPPDEALPKVLDHADAHIPIAMRQYGMNPVQELPGMREISAAFDKAGADICLNYTIKPNIFGTLAAGRLGLPVINNVAGAGRAFSSGSPMFWRFIKSHYRVAFRKSSAVFFQNSDDHRLFLDAHVLPEAKARRLPGSGVDLTQFSPSPLPDGPVNFLFIRRLLTKKGVVEFLDAAQQVLQSGAEARFALVGELENQPGYVAADVLDAALKDDRITYHGTVDPSVIPGLVASATSVVLPSYYGEGVPRSLLEASASGRPIITTDNVGCRDAIEPEVTGYMVPPRDSAALAEAMMRFLALGDEDRRAMADAARAKMEREFDEQIVLSAYRREIEAALGRPLGRD